MVKKYTLNLKDKWFSSEDCLGEKRAKNLPTMRNGIEVCPCSCLLLFFKKEMTSYSNIVNIPSALITIYTCLKLSVHFCTQ